MNQGSADCFADRVPANVAQLGERDGGRPVDRDGEHTPSALHDASPVRVHPVGDGGVRMALALHNSKPA